MLRRARAGLHATPHREAWEGRRGQGTLDVRSLHGDMSTWLQIRSFSGGGAAGGGAPGARKIWTTAPAANAAVYCNVVPSVVRAMATARPGRLRRQDGVRLLLLPLHGSAAEQCLEHALVA